MKQLTIMAGLLIAPALIAGAIGGDVDWPGRLGIALVFAFTAIGHFIKTDAMAEMLPPAVPQRRAVIRIIPGRPHHHRIPGRSVFLPLRRFKWVRDEGSGGLDGQL
jgi:hypothetical protein